VDLVLAHSHALLSPLPSLCRNVRGSNNHWSGMTMGLQCAMRKDNKMDENPCREAYQPVAMTWRWERRWWAKAKLSQLGTRLVDGYSSLHDSCTCHRLRVHNLRSNQSPIGDRSTLSATITIGIIVLAL
jgi:hypothetical protein